MSQVEEKLAKSLTAESVELIPFLPYLLCDLWELGSSPTDIIYLIKKHIKKPEQMKVLDLACGKGAVSVQLAKQIGCQVKGIDITLEFIEFARKKAKELGVECLCEFQVEDINESVNIEKNYDLVILGSVGDVLGNPEETILKLKNIINPGGWIIIDDAYGKDGVNIDYYSKNEWCAIFNKTNVKLVEEVFVNDDALIDLNREQQDFIVKRAKELIEQYPEKASLFESYIQSQQAEC
ncbi:MAG TPA: methyltransferase type 12, partial [Clostridiales bacterium]|nr:methyltransferase type 12 [Clostridiales bacterium]